MNLREQIPSVEHVLFLGAGPQRYADRYWGYSELEIDGLEDDLRPDSPKGATLTHGSIIGAAHAQATHVGTTQDDVYIGVMPLNHVGGIRAPSSLRS